MKGVGPRLGDHVDDAAERGAEFRLVVVRVYLEFLNGIDDGRHDVSTHHSLVVDTVQHEEIAPIGLPVDGRKHKLAPLGYGNAEWPSGVLGHTNRSDTGCQRKQLGEVSAVQR